MRWDGNCHWWSLSISDIRDITENELIKKNNNRQTIHFTNYSIDLIIRRWQWHRIRFDLNGFFVVVSLLLLWFSLSFPNHWLISMFSVFVWCCVFVYYSPPLTNPFSDTIEWATIPSIVDWSFVRQTIHVLSPILLVSPQSHRNDNDDGD